MREVLDPATHSQGPNLSNRKNVIQWRFFLGEQIGLHRGWGCVCCGSWHRRLVDSYCSMDIFDLHEGIVSRGDVQGWSFEKRGLIFHEYNSFWLCRDCHQDHKLSREAAWELSCEWYGEELVKEWYESLPWRAGVPRRFWDEED